MKQPQLAAMDTNRNNPKHKQSQTEASRDRKTTNQIDHKQERQKSKMISEWENMFL